jgi:hypothetical protein
MEVVEIINMATMMCVFVQIVFGIGIIWNCVQIIWNLRKF